MKPLDLCVFLTGYTLTVGFAAVADLLRRRRAAALLNVIVALIAIAVTTVVGFYVEPGTSYVQLLMGLIRERDFSAAASIALGVAAGLTWVARLTDPVDTDGNTPRRGIAHTLTPMILALSIVGVVLSAQAFIWKSILGLQRDPIARVHVPGFVIEKIADLDFLPIRIAADEGGNVYVSYDYFESWGTIGGAIVQLSRETGTGDYRKKIVADSTLLMRSYGLAARDGSLFVSRTGICSSAMQGNISYQSTGAVTQLRDLDGDGYFEYAHDLLAELPGARGPDTMQQNNAIAFAPDGSLFIANACAANRAMDDHPWAGTVLRISPDFTRTEVFAKGFRNPFGMLIGPDDELFVTDNDIDENPGDELNHVIQGNHYGHPFVVPNEPGVAASGFCEPIHVGELESNYLGMAYVTSNELPEAYRNCIYLADYMQNRIWRLRLARAGETYRVAAIEPFASLSTPVDVAAGPQGDLFVISRRTQNVYRIAYRQAAAGG
jgi:glucose/arabinose dehydrogenase